MKNRFILLAIAACLGAVSCSDRAVKPAIPSDPQIEKAVEKTLAKMTLEEKVGQMTEIGIDILGHFEGDNWVMDVDKVENAIGKYKVGSILNTPVVGQTPEKWQEIIGLIQEVLRMLWERLISLRTSMWAHLSILSLPMMPV